MNDVKDIISIVKHKGKYRIYFPNIELKNIEDKICKWWGQFDTFDECLEQLLLKDEYIHLEIDKDLLRKIKIRKIDEKIKKI